MNYNGIDEICFYKAAANFWQHNAHSCETQKWVAFPVHYFCFISTASVVPNAVLWPILAQVRKQSAGERISLAVQACLSLFSYHLLEFI